MTATLTSPALRTRYLSEPDMVAAGVKDMPACVDTMEKMFSLLGRGDYRMAGANANSHGAMVLFPEESPHARMPKNGPDRRFMAMPAYLGGDFHASGVKWYGSNIENRKSGLPRSIHTFILNDADTGAPLAIMNANLLSSYRTGAVSGVGARHLAKPGATVAAVVGPGVMGKTALEAFVAGVPTLHTVKIKGRSQAGIDSFVAWVRDTLPQFTTIEVVDTEEEAVRGAEVIAYTTTAPVGSGNYPQLDPSWLSPGAFVSIPSCVNMPDDWLISGAGRLVLDNRSLYESWHEEFGDDAFETVGIIGNKFLALEKQGAIGTDAVVDIADVINGDAVGRRSDDDIVIYSVGGMPVEDVAWATTLYRRACEGNIGTVLPVWDVPEMA
ncbi:tyramine oxidase subunit B [Corynebacterium terpenotabidum]|uniref:Ornithine cyclodeaminase n=1 Tax=Corynebacterium terpenotabidum Y-11 TaxID=1200352 RepID=S4XFQ1_9CORY|nr:tyramine oxidase subunit B [Corynebacterium terpenotabidum]AGP30455.1 ornithine cyclodeaminase [Corynebacterium terpenotabidum Y-11]